MPLNVKPFKAVIQKALKAKFAELPLLAEIKGDRLRVTNTHWILEADASLWGALGLPAGRTKARRLRGNGPVESEGDTFVWNDAGDACFNVPGLRPGFVTGVGLRSGDLFGSLMISLDGAAWALVNNAYLELLSGMSLHVSDRPATPVVARGDGYSVSVMRMFVPDSQRVALVGAAGLVAASPGVLA